MTKSKVKANISDQHIRQDWRNIFFVFAALKKPFQEFSIPRNFTFALLILCTTSSVIGCFEQYATIAATSKQREQGESRKLRVQGKKSQSKIQNRKSKFAFTPHFSLLLAQTMPTTELKSKQKQVDVTQKKVGDPELGTLRVQEQKLQSPPYKPVAHLLGQVGYFQSNNIFSGVDPVDDGLFSTGLTLYAAPKLGKKTSLVTAIDGRLIRYVDHTNANYNLLRLRAGLRHQLTPEMYGEFGWNNLKLFGAKTGDRFLDENALRLAVQRQDKITNKLWLNSLYEFQLGFADPDNRSRVINSLSTDLVYYVHPKLQLGVGYQFALSDFTRRDRTDNFHLIQGGLTYVTSSDSQINFQGGVSFGGSDDPNIDFDNLFLSISYTIDLGGF